MSWPAVLNRSIRLYIDLWTDKQNVLSIGRKSLRILLTENFADNFHAVALYFIFFFPRNSFVKRNNIIYIIGAITVICNLYLSTFHARERYIIACWREKKNRYKLYRTVRSCGWKKKSKFFFHAQIRTKK